MLLIYSVFIMHEISKICGKPRKHSYFSAVRKISFDKIYKLLDLIKLDPYKSNKTVKFVWY